MTESAWRFCFGMPLLYLGAFLSGLRPARWYGTRLLPLVGAGAFAALLLLLPVALVVRLPSSIFIPVLLGAYGLFVVSICHVARVRDY